MPATPEHAAGDPVPREESADGSSAEFVPPSAAAATPWDSETRELVRSRESFIGPYRVEMKIGEGGMGVVYKGFDAALARFVAIKVLKEKFGRNDRYLVRLKREARAVASVSHPAVIQVFAFEDGSDRSHAGVPAGAVAQHAGLPYLVMEYVEGESVDTRLRLGQRFEVDEAIGIVLAAARGLRAAHERGIIHRDVKPSNLLLVVSGGVKIVDFGLSKELDGDASITDEGIVLGTPHYISPEQGQGHRVDHRSDIYSLGATFYHIVTGRPVFDGESHASIIYSHVHEPPQPPHVVREGVPQAVSHVIGKMLTKDAARRYNDYDDLIADLERIRDGKSLGKETTAVSSRTFRPAWWRSRAAFWFVAGLAAWTGLALVVLLALAVLQDGGTSEDAAVLAIYRSAADTVEPGGAAGKGDTPGEWTFDFRRIASTAALREVFAFDAGERPTLHRTGGLRLAGRLFPLTLRYPISRLDSVTVEGLTIHGIVDLEIAVRHPVESRVRTLHVTLRGNRKANTSPVERPLIATRNAEDVRLDPVPEQLPPLVGDPCDVTLRFERGERVTRVFLTVERRRPGRPSERIYPRDGESGFVLQGTDWGSGVLEIRPYSATSASLAEPSWVMQALRVAGELEIGRLAATAGDRVRA